MCILTPAVIAEAIPIETLDLFSKLKSKEL